MSKHAGGWKGALGNGEATWVRGQGAPSEVAGRALSVTVAHDLHCPTPPCGGQRPLGAHEPAPGGHPARCEAHCPMQAGSPGSRGAVRAETRI